VIYATAPASKIVGTVEVIKILEDSPKRIWESTKEFAGITELSFEKYYTGRTMAVAYELGDIRRYSKPKLLKEIGLTFAPQSFVYLQ
jgi:predicted transcriptional regulator